MAFEKGNTHAKKGKLFERAIKGCLAENDYQRLRGIAEQVVALAETGERWAVEMLRDTLDGKPAQQIVATDEDGRSLAIGLIAYAAEVRPDDPPQGYPDALPPPGRAGARRG